MKLEKQIEVTKILKSNSAWVKNLDLKEGVVLHIEMTFDRTFFNGKNYARYINITNLCTGKVMTDVSINTFVKAMNGGIDMDQVFEYKELDINFTK